MQRAWIMTSHIVGQWAGWVILLSYMVTHCTCDRNTAVIYRLGLLRCLSSVLDFRLYSNSSDICQWSHKNNDIKTFIHYSSNISEMTNICKSSMIHSSVKAQFTKVHFMFNEYPCPHLHTIYFDIHTSFLKHISKICLNDIKYCIFKGCLNGF